MAEIPFQAGQAFESMRDSDFDSISAFGEVIDNSIQANARVVNIRFNTSDQGRKKIIDSVVFSDDGCGMDTEVLQKCLKLGWSARYNNRDGIGRFGVGMTLGAIHECRRVEVYSKQTDGDWYHTYLDLDEISDADRNDEVWKIPNPQKKNPSSNEKIPPSYIPDDCGTIVFWSKYDRLKDTFDTLMREFANYIGRTYRYFIWNKALPGKNKPVREYPVSIKLNGKEVFAHDPLYVTTEKTKFPEDLQAEEYTPMRFPWALSEFEEGEDSLVENSSADVHIRWSFLPKEWRQTQGQGISKDAKDRQIPENEGFSILRAGREVFYDWIPRYARKSKEVDRWWGCEIHFDPSLDYSFSVKNIKRGAVPSKLLKEKIDNETRHTMMDCRNAVSHYYKQFEEEKKREKSGFTAEHHIAQEVAKETKVLPSKIGLDEPSAEEARVRIADEFTSDPDERKILLDEFRSNEFTILDKSWSGSNFYEILHTGGKDIIQYNSRHIFFEIFKEIRDEIGDGINVDYNAQRLIALLDILMISFAKTESRLEPDTELTSEDFIEFFKNDWGQFLKQYSKTFQKKHGQTN